MDEIRTYRSDINTVSSLRNLPWDKFAGKNILITGATGLIGSCLVDVLMNHQDADYCVYAMGRNKDRADNRFMQYYKSGRFVFIEHDIINPLKSEIPFHYIIACASGANPVLYTTKPVDVIKANVIGVDNLMIYGIYHQIERFIYISSGDVYGEGDGSVFTEDYSGYVNPMVLRSCYPSAKRASESLCVAYGAQYGVNISVLRPCHIYGPYFTETDTRAYAQFIRNAILGENIVLKSSGSQLRSWCYVVDCVAAILYITLLGNKGEAYNIADNSSNISIRNFAEIIAKVTGRTVILDTPDIIEASGYNAVSKSIFDTKKLEALGWTPIGGIKDNICVTIKELLMNEDYSFASCN